MTNEEMQKNIEELLAWKASREVQQLSYPVDDASRASLGAATSPGAGSTTKTASTVVSSLGQTVTYPAPYAQTFILEINGNRYEVPSLT